MKPTSVVAIIVAAVIMTVGIVTCLAANGVAEKNGTPLFAESRGDDYIHTVDLTEGDIIKISLNITDADVNIYGSSATSYIEFVNFRETLYSLSVSNTSVSFNEIPDFSSMLRFWENGFSFKGMRFVFNPRTYDNSRMKSVNIYLSSDCEIKQFNITADTVTVSLENLSCPADYIFKADDIAVYASSVKTNSMLKIGARNGSDPSEKAKVEFNSSSFSSVVINADKLNLTGETNGLQNVKVTSKTGEITWSMPNYALSAPMTNAKLSIGTAGNLLINGAEVQSPFKFDNTDGETVYSIDIDAGEADVVISDLSIDLEPSPGETEPDTSNDSGN